MKILFYINVLSNGGAERVMSNLANELSLENDVVLVNSFRTNNEYELNSSIKHIYLDDNSYKGFFEKNFARIKLLRKYLKKEKPDIAISFMAEPNFRLLLAKAFMGTKTIISIRNDPNKEYGNLLFKILAKSLFVTSNGIVFQTKEAKKWFPKMIQSRSRVIYNPVKQVFYDTKTNDNPENIVAVGRLSKQKNHKLLIEAFAEISDKITDNLFIYGAGELEFELKKLVEKLNLNNRVFLMGNVQNIENELSKYKMYIMTSDYEGMPNSLMEAMALGVPCISTDCPCGGPRELMKKETLCRVNDKEMLKDLILKYANDKQKLKELSLYNKNKSIKFKNDIITKEWKNYIDQIMKN